MMCGPCAAWALPAYDIVPIPPSDDCRYVGKLAGSHREGFVRIEAAAFPDILQRLAPGTDRDAHQFCTTIPLRGATYETTSGTSCRDIDADGGITARGTGQN